MKLWRMFRVWLKRFKKALDVLNGELAKISEIENSLGRVVAVENHYPYGGSAYDGNELCNSVTFYKEYDSNEKVMLEMLDDQRREARKKFFQIFSRKKK